MKELSLNVLDIAENSVKAGASLIRITITETEETLTMTVADNGCGMREEILRGVIDPFYTTRTTRKVGLGIPLLKLAAEQTGGSIRICSRHESEYPEDHGTETSALFYKTHIDYTPMGDIVSTVVTLIQGSPEIDFEFLHTSPQFRVELDTRQMREILGEGIPLSDPEIIRWITQFLKEQYENITNNE
ncbi:MAG: ATP-binding protein [Ruminococcaceae bacterium]|nr:ATP-binding protein [Oscillospiraceae bacterium]